MRRRPLLALVGTAAIAGCTGYWSDDEEEVDELTQMLADREARIDELEMELEDERGDVQALEAELDELEEKVEQFHTLEAKVDELEDELERQEELSDAGRELLEELYLFADVLLEAAREDIEVADAAIDDEDWTEVFLSLQQAAARLDLSGAAFDRLESVLADVDDEALSVVETATEFVRNARVIIEAAIDDAAAAATTADMAAIERLQDDDGYRAFKDAIPDDISSANAFAAALEA